MQAREIPPIALALFHQLLKMQTAKGVAEYGGPLTAATDIDPLLEAMKENVDQFVYLVDEYVRRERTRQTLLGVRTLLNRWPETSDPYEVGDLLDCIDEAIHEITPRLEGEG